MSLDQGKQTRLRKARPVSTFLENVWSRNSDSDVFLRPPSGSANHGSRSPSPDSGPSRSGTPKSARYSIFGAPAAASPPAFDDTQDSLDPSSALRAEKKKNNRRSWFAPTGRVKSESEENTGPHAWILGDEGKVAYDSTKLLDGQSIPEIWDPKGDCLVYVSSQDMYGSASFRINSAAFGSSRVLRELSMSPLTNHTPGPERHLHITVDQPAPGEHGDDEGTAAYVSMRNLFAFLMGKPLVATRHRPSLFDVFIEISKLLRFYEFNNIDGSTYGEVVTTRFDQYMDEHNMLDVRASLEKTVEGIALGERMKSVKLYHEAFTHCVGKYDLMLKLESPKFHFVSAISVNRINREAMELSKNINNVRLIFEDLEFPSIFSNIESSRTAEERSYMDVDQWKEAFFATRKFFIKFYKNRYKSWPPKAPSKDSIGLNRLVLREIYNDLSSVYDLLVDRSRLTPRIVESTLSEDASAIDPRAKTVRQIFSEYDRSSPPMKPPIPLDLPIFPSSKPAGSGSDTGDEKRDSKAPLKSLKSDEMEEVLTKSYNDGVAATEFVDTFKDFERKSARLRNLQGMDDRRIGHWIFIYALLQALPVLIMDAPGLQHVNDVEYFLCRPPKFGVPWTKEATSHGVGSYDGANGGGPAWLPADLAEPGIEGVYRRSHCWVMAEQWNADKPEMLSTLQQRVVMAQPPPPPSSVPALAIGEESNVVGSSRNPSPSSPHPASRLSMKPVVTNDPAKTFDAILANTAGQAGGKKGKKK